MDVRGSNPRPGALYRTVQGGASELRSVFIFIMYYVYVLLSKKDNKFYIGFTENLKERIKKHKSGQIFATKGRLPIVLLFYEAYLNKYDALRREKYLKTEKGKTTLKSMLSEKSVNLTSGFSLYILKTMRKKEITIEVLARMIQKGFDETATKAEMKKGFNEVYKRFDKIENLILIDHKRRIERLEFEVKELKELLAIK